ncbi:MAG: phosphatase [Kangiellaceae bacterium]|nr:phosphatase [Kangiellaceae bacterium]
MFSENTIVTPQHYAAIDLGSNSFHLAVAEYDGNAFRVIGRIKQKVQLANGLDNSDMLSQEAMQRGLDCLTLFAERIKDIPFSHVKVVATYTLRKAKNSSEFVHQAKQILNHSIDILPGTEEARLIYDGVSHNHPDIQRALVIDIGGGSTEIILGDKFDPIFLDSLSIGCVTYGRYFPNGIINATHFNKAVDHAAIEVSPVEKRYFSDNWEHCLGSSGSIEAIYQVLVGFGYNEGFITFEHLKLLKQKLIDIGHIDNIKLEGLSSSRINTFATGVAILYALFQELKIDKMYIANGSLREGILLELAEELKGNDIRHQTANSLMFRFNIDQQHAFQVLVNAQHIFEQVADMWAIYDPIFKNYLDWACKLHEIGLSISFAKLRYHSAYVVEHADMPGFSQQTKDSLSAIIANQRKKIDLTKFDYKYDDKGGLLAVTQVLRLATLFNIKRDGLDISELTFKANVDNAMQIFIPSQWADEHQLIITELEKEKSYLNYHNIEFNWQLI